MSKRSREQAEENEQEADARRRHEFDSSTFVTRPHRQSLAGIAPIEFIASLRARLPTIEDGVYVTHSRIPEAGRGLFATTSYLPGDLITFYDGPIIRHRAVLPPQYQTHARQLEFHAFTILGNYPPFNEPRPGFGGGAFINDGLRAYAANAEFVHLDSWRYLRTRSPFERIIGVRALRGIDAGDEIYVSYGPDYWRAAAVSSREAAIPVTDADLLSEADWTAAAEAAARDAADARAKRRRIVPTPLREENLCSICHAARAIWVEVSVPARFFCRTCAHL